MTDLPAIPSVPGAWDPNSGAPLPAHIADALGELGTNIPDRQTVPSLSYEGKNWTIVMDGNKTKLQEKNGDGDMIPVPIMHAVILNLNSERGRAYYPGTYNPAASTAPVCWSADGKAPDASVVTKQSPACANCPMSVKGSKITDDGREGVACGSHRMLAVLPATDLAFRPLRLKIAVTSDFDKDVVEHGWFALRQYLDFLKSRGVTHSALVVTKIKFDPNVAYPKLLFSLSRVLTAEEIAQIKGLINSPQVMDLLAEKWTAAGVDGVPTDGTDMAPGAALPKPTSADHIAHAGTTSEVWWHPVELAWVAPWIVEQAAPPPTPPAPEPEPIPASQQVIEQPPAAPAPEYDPIAAAHADGWAAHPDSAGYHWKGTEVVTTADLAAKYPGNAPAGQTAAAPPAPPSTPTPAPEPQPVPVASPSELAAQAGWLDHPNSPPHMYRGQEVLTREEVLAQFGGNAAAPGTAPGATPTATIAGGPTATTGASPSDAIPPEVQGLLDKWTGGEAPTA